MSFHPLIVQIATLIVAVLPSSLFVIQLLEKAFAKYNTKIGKTTTICTSVTGTLTKNVIRVKSILFDKFEGEIKSDSQLVHLEDKESHEEIRVEKKVLQNHEAIEMMATITKICSQQKHARSEEVLSIFFKKCYLNISQLADKYVKIQQIEEEEEKKFTSYVVSNKDSYEHFTFSKGNPYDLLEKCTRMLYHGRKIDIDYALRRKLKDKVKKYNRQGEKVIAFAYKALPLKRLEYYSPEFAEKEMIFLGFLGFGDSINKELQEVVEEIQSQGIKTYVLTGIRERNAIAIGQRLGITSTKYFQGVTSQNLGALNESKLKKMLANREKDFVFSEMTNEDKQRIIKTLTEIGETVVYLESRDKNSLKNLLKNIQKSRQSKLNYQKITNHAISSKIAQLTIVVAAITFQAPLALTFALILLIDLSSNTLLEIGLQKENVDTTKPQEEEHKIFQKDSAFAGIVLSIVLLGIFFWNLTRFGWQPGENIAPNEAAFISTSTLIYLILNLGQIFNAFIINRGGPLNNIYLLLTAAISILISLLILLFPPLQNFFNLQLPSKFDWQIIAFSSLIILIILSLWKYFHQKTAISESK